MEATFAAAASGDVETARIAHDAAGKLLAKIEGPAVEAARVAYEAAGKMLASLPQVSPALPPSPRRTRRRERRG
jgi:hypothetical protein